MFVVVVVVVLVVLVLVVVVVVVVVVMLAGERAAREAVARSSCIGRERRPESHRRATLQRS